MKKIILEKITSSNANFRNPTNDALSSRGSFLIPLVIMCFALCQHVQAKETPDPGSVGGSFDTADGTNALANVTTDAANQHLAGFRS